ncbi:MAG: ribosome silencing factor [Clostridiales bacterium]|nr:ribosome silencing factor [Clostridiales bacterium]
MTPSELMNEIVKILDKKKAIDIKAIRTTELTIVSDYFIIASGTSVTHTRSLADDLEFEMGKLGVNPHNIEGRATGWILLDYGSVLVHIFQAEMREYYNLERLWSDAQSVDISGLITEA